MKSLYTLIEEAKHYVKATNPSTAPYHNTEHMLRVCVLADEMFQYETQRRGEEPRATFDLQLAALFHDYGHSGGTQSDTTNIAVAISAMRDYARGVFTDATVERAEAMIRCTEYSNGAFPVAPQTLLEECLRDADVLYTTMRREPHVVLDDLRSEMEVLLKRPITHREMLEGQLKFNQSVTFFTTTGHELWTRNNETFWRLLEEYVERAEKDIPFCGAACLCHNRNPVLRDELRSMWWHYGVVEYTSRDQRPKSSLPGDTYALQESVLVHDLAWLEYLNSLAIYLGPGRTAAYPRTVAKLAEMLAEARAEVAPVYIPSRKHWSGPACRVMLKELQNFIQFLYRPTTL